MAARAAVHWAGWLLVNQNSEMMGRGDCGSDGLNVCQSKRETTGLEIGSVACYPCRKGENGDQTDTGML